MTKVLIKYYLVILLCNTKILQILTKHLKNKWLTLYMIIDAQKKKKILDYYVQGLKKQDARFRINLKIIQDYFMILISC